MDNKTLTDMLSRRLDISVDTVGQLIEAMSASVGRCAAALDVVAVPSFGFFESRRRSERLAVHPSTGRKLLVPPRITIAFRPSAILKQKVKDGE